MTSNTLPEPVVNLIQATSGGLAAVSAISLFFPLDTARVYFQLDDDAANKSTMEMILKIVNDEGLWALYRGLGPISQSLMCSQFVYFYTYNFLKARLRSDSPSVLRDLTSGFLAGCVNVLLTNPLWVANARMRVRGTKVLRHRRTGKGGETEQTTQAKAASAPLSANANEAQYTSLVRTIRAIAKTEGIAACWRGTVPSMILCVNPAVQFALYEALRRFVVRRIATRAGIAESVVALGTLQTFVISLIAKWVATVGTYPLQLVQTRLRTGLHSSDTKHSQSFSEYFTSIVQQRGVAGLFRGLESKLLQTVLTSAFLMVVYEKLVAYLFRLLNVRKNH